MVRAPSIGPLVGRTLIWIATASATFLGARQASADTCSPALTNGCMGITPPCNIVNKFDGGDQVRSSSPWPESADALITTFNPYPVWSNSTAWTALENQLGSSGRIAQVGYDHWYGCQYGKCSDGNTWVITQWTDNNGNFSPIIFLGRTDYQGSTSAHYEVDRASNGTFTTYAVLSSGWLYEYVLPTSVTWGPDTYETSGEVLDYDGNSGSHVVGNKTTHVNVTNAYWLDQNGGWHDPSMQWFSFNTGTSTYSTWYQYLTNKGVTPGQGVSFDIWDNRCY